MPSVTPRMAASSILQPRISKKTDRPTIEVPKGQTRRSASPRSSMRCLSQRPIWNRMDHPRAPTRRRLRRRCELSKQVHFGMRLQPRAHQKALFIVLAEYHDHYLATPLYTHDDTCLDRKPNQDGCVYVHDKYRVSRRPLKQRKDRHLAATIDLQTRIPLYRPKSAAHLNESYCGEELLPEA